MLKKILLVLSILIAVECIVAVGKPLKGIRTSNYRFHTSRKAVLAEEHDRNDLVVAENVAFSSIEATTQQQTVTSIILGNWFVLSQFLCMGLAYLNPSIGRTGGVLKPEITVSKLGVSLIFFFNGLKISAEQLKEASSDLRINFLVLFYNLVFIPLVTRFLVAPFIPSELLRNGIIALSVLPCTINVCVTMTQAAKGNVSSAIFNAVVGNLVGVVWSPIIIYYLLGGAGSAAGGSGLSLLDTLTKLGSVVLVPLLAGQLLRLFPIDNLVKRWGNAMGVMSQVVLLGIVYQSFSDTFLRPEGFGISGATLGGLVAALPVAYLLASYGFWKLSKMFLPNLDIKTRCAATFCSSQKTMAFGIPLIKAVFGETNNIAVLIAPILILTPVQLMLCSGVIVPVMRRSINKYNAQQEEMKTKLLSSGLMLRGGYTSHQDHINKQNTEIISDAMAKLKLKITAEEEKSFPEIFVKESEACINPSSEFVEKMAVNGTDGFVSPRIPTSMIKLPKPHKKSFLVKLVQNTKFRVILTTLCGICVLFDLAEDILTSIPRLHSFTKRLKTRQGVFFLTLSSLISALSELIDRLDSRDEALEEDYAEKMAERYLSRSYALEEQAARAYDMAAIAIHGRQASLNFQYPTMDVDREGRLPEKYSEYRGVKWSNEDQAWLVDEAFL